MISFRSCDGLRWSRQPTAGRRRRPVSLVMLLVGAVVLLSACSLPGYGTPEAVTKQGDNIDRLWKASAAAALIVGVIVWGLILWAVFRYRKRSDELPRQVGHNTPIEVLYTTVPFLIIGLLFYYTAFSENYVNRLTENPDVTIGVVGFRWNWQFDYVGQDLQVVGRPGEPPQLVIPTERTIRFILTSPDVIHSFWVPQFMFKRDVIPGRVNQFEVVVDTPGTFIGRCAELCGTDHDRMTFFVKAVPPAEYDAYIAQQRRLAPAATTNATVTTPGLTGTAAGSAQ